MTDHFNKTKSGMLCSPYQLTFYIKEQEVFKYRVFNFFKYLNQMSQITKINQKVLINTAK